MAKEVHEFDPSRAITRKGVKLDVVSRLTRLPNGKTVLLSEREAQLLAIDTSITRQRDRALQPKMSAVIRAFAHLDGLSLPDNVAQISLNNLPVLRRNLRRKLGLEFVATKKR